MLLVCFSAMVFQSTAQLPVVQVLASGKKTSLRGLSVVNDQVVWASGSGGTVARSADGGQSWSWLTVAGYEKRDFRDIEAFDELTAVIMAVADPGVILKTKDGGKSWLKVFEDSAKGVFMDAMDFQQKRGIVFGDPGPDHSLYMVTTYDRGDTWQKIKAPVNYDTLQEGEAFFASSGTNVQFRKDGSFAGVSGGKRSRLFYPHGRPVTLPIIQGRESTGANSIAFAGNHAVIVGGDFTKDTVSNNNCVLVAFNKNIPVLSVPRTSPHGYRSCVIYLNGNNLLTCGTSGIDLSHDGGVNWRLLSLESYHVCRKASNGHSVFLAGGNGRIAKLVSP